MDAIATVIIHVLIFILMVYHPSYVYDYICTFFSFMFCVLDFWLQVCYGILVVMSITLVIAARQELSQYKLTHLLNYHRRHQQLKDT